MKREVKIGIFAVAMIGVAWAGIRLLKGFDIFSRNVEYYAAYDQINGVQNASPIMMKGVKIGSVTRLSFDPALRHKRHDPDLPPADLSGAYRGVPDSLYNITAVHIPQLWGQIADAGYGALTLAGHVHSMQMKLRLFGRAFSPAQLLYTRWSGRYDEGGRTLYINDGTGYVVFPMRLGAYPEITLITLRRCE